MKKEEIEKELAKERAKLNQINAELDLLYQNNPDVSEVRANSVARLQKRLPSYSPAEIGFMVNKLIADVKAELPEPMKESEIKRRAKKIAGIK